MGYIKEIINNFKFCTIDFTSRGDISKLSSDITETIIANLKELNKCIEILKSYKNGHRP